MDLPQNAELLGSSTAPLPVAGAGVQTTVQLTPAGQRYLATGPSATASEAAPVQVYLALENVRGTRDATLLNVYLALPSGGQTGAHHLLLAGGAALYGLRRASNPQGSNRGGLTLVFDITPLLEELQVPQVLQSNEFRVSIVPDRPLADTSDIVIERVRLFRLPPS